MARNRGAHKNINQLVNRLADPYVRLEDNSAYKVDTETLGILYANFVGTVNEHISPGMALLEMPKMSRFDLYDYKRKFQRNSREFLFQRLGELAWRESTASGFKGKYGLLKFPNDFTEDTIEHHVVKLARQANLQLLGLALKRGAHNFHQKRDSLEYSLAAEYDKILEAFQKVGST